MVKSNWMPALALRLAIYGLMVPLGFIVAVPDSFEVLAWWSQQPMPWSPVPVEPVVVVAPNAVSPVSQIAVAPGQPAIASAPLPSVQELFAEGARIHELFDAGRLHEVYASFSDAAKAQVPEDVFVAQASEVLQQLGPRKPDGWDDANLVSTLLNGRSKGRKVLLWKLHPETLMFDMGSWRFGSLSDASEDLVLDVSGGRIRLAMFSEYKAQPPVASVWLPRTCSLSGQDPLQQCTVPDKPTHIESSTQVIGQLR